MKDSLRSICNIPFLFCLAILLLNDFYLKSEYHNWVTGKVSDFCGLFVFASFWSAVFPSKKLVVHFLIGLFFIVWKSPYSQPLIDFFSNNFYSIYRVVDVTDLSALLVLPLSYFFTAESIRLTLNPLPLALVSVIAFCATSVPKPTQKFNQPQYLLFKKGALDFVSHGHPSIFHVHELDSFVVVSIVEMGIEKRPPLDDEFHKVQVLKELDLRILREIKDDNSSTTDLEEYKDIRNDLVAGERVSIELKLDSVTDRLNFRRTRLHGEFRRLSENGGLLIHGRYNDGIEDSIWTVFNNENVLVSKKHFENGELTKTEFFKGLNLVSKEEYRKREETIRMKYFNLSIIGVLIFAVATKLTLTFRRSNRDNIIELSNFTQMAGILLLPFVIFILSAFVSSVIFNTPSDFFRLILELIAVHLIGAPLFFIVFYLLRLRSKFDLLFYIILFALILVFRSEYLFLHSIMY